MRNKPEVYERPLHKEILLLTHSFYGFYMREPLPAYQNWPWHHRILGARQHGPWWAIDLWFPESATPAHAKACQRAIADLENAKLIKVTYRMQNIKLTDAGLAIVRRLKRRARAEAKALAILKARPVTPPKSPPLTTGI